MGVDENQLNEIFEERARYLINMDEIIFENLGETAAFEMKSDEEHVFHNVSGEFRTSIEIMNPEPLSKRKIQPLAPKRLNEEDITAAEEA